VGYIITSIDDKRLMGPADLETELKSRPPGTKIRLSYMFRSSAFGSQTYYPSQAILVVPPRCSDSKSNPTPAGSRAAGCNQGVAAQSPAMIAPMLLERRTWDRTGEKRRITFEMALFFRF
jgi:hypothetical protein